MRRWTLALLTVVAVAIGCAYWLGPWSRQRLLKRWQADLPTIEEAQLTVRMRQLSELGAEGLEVVVSAIGHERAVVAQKARLELDHQLRLWRQASASRTAKNVLVVARQMAADVNQWGVSTRIYAADIAAQILAWPTENGQQSQQIIRHCETVLTSVTAAKKPVPTNNATKTTNQASQPKLEARGSFRHPHKLEQRNLEFPGGGLPIELVSIPGSVKRLETSDEPSSQPPRRQGADQSFPPELLNNPDAKPLDVDSQDAKKKSDGRRPSLMQPSPAARRLSAEVNDKSAKPTVITKSSWQRMHDVEVLRQLHATEPLRIRAAWKELRRRGYRVTDLGMAEEITHSDAKKRLAAAEQIAGSSLASGRRWLLILSEDKDKRVRRAAAAIMATTQDLQLILQLRKMQATETDRDILRLISKRLNQR